MPRLPPCAWRSRPGPRKCGCSSAVAGWPIRRQLPWRGIEVAMRWVCIVFPQLALDGAQRVHPEPEQPLALLAGTPQRRVLQTVNAAARALGLRPGNR